MGACSADDEVRLECGVASAAPLPTLACDCCGCSETPLVGVALDGLTRASAVVVVVGGR